MISFDNNAINVITQYNRTDPFTFDELKAIYKEIEPLKEYDLSSVVVGAMWIFQPVEYYQHLKGIEKINKYNDLFIHQIFFLFWASKMSVTNRYDIYIPEQITQQKREEISNDFMDMIEEIRVFNSKLRLQGYIKADQVVVQLLRDTKEAIQKVETDELDTEILGELFWIEALLDIFWDYLGIKKKRAKKLFKKIKRTIYYFLDRVSVDEKTRDDIKLDYREKSSSEIMELRIVETFDTTWKLFSKVVRRLLGKSRSEEEKKLELLLERSRN